MSKRNLEKYLGFVLGGEWYGDKLLVPFHLGGDLFCVHSLDPAAGIKHNRYLVSRFGEQCESVLGEVTPRHLSWRCTCPHWQFQHDRSDFADKHIILIKSRSSLPLEPDWLRDRWSNYQ